MTSSDHHAKPEAVDTISDLIEESNRLRSQVSQLEGERDVDANGLILKLRGQVSALTEANEDAYGRIDALQIQVNSSEELVKLLTEERDKLQAENARYYESVVTLDGRLVVADAKGPNDPLNVVAAIKEYVAAEDNLGEGFDDDGYHLSGAVKQLAYTASEVEALTEDRDALKEQLKFTPDHTDEAVRIETDCKGFPELLVPTIATALSVRDAKLQAAEARCAKLEKAARPVLARMTNWHREEECDCSMEGGFHSCGEAQSRRELDTLRAALSPEENTDTETTKEN